MKKRTQKEWQDWLKEFSREKNIEAWRGIMCFLRWIQIRQENGHPIPEFLMGLEGDIYHSYLLRRMLAGEEPLSYPPPESFGLPWYDLIHQGEGIAEEVHLWEWAPDQKISINQGIWTILEKKSETDFVVTYRIQGDPFQLTQQADGKWLLKRTTFPS